VVCSPSAVMCLDDLHAEVAVGDTKTQRVCFSVGPSKGQCRGPDGKLVPGPCALPLMMAFVLTHLRWQPATQTPELPPPRVLQGVFLGVLF
jgi:hypothetical protein